MNTYGVFFRLQGPQTETDYSDHGLHRWQLVTNKRTALRWGKAASAIVGVVRNSHCYGSVNAWDAPTFRTTMDVIADYR